MLSWLRSVTPSDRCTPWRRARSARRSVCGPGTGTAFSYSARKNGCWSTGARTRFHTGNAGTNDSPKTTSWAPPAAGSATSAASVSSVASRSRNTGAACTAAARKRGNASPDPIAAAYAARADRQNVAPHARPADPVLHQRRARRPRARPQGPRRRVGRRRPGRPLARARAVRPGPRAGAADRAERGRRRLDADRRVAREPPARPAAVARRPRPPRRGRRVRRVVQPRLEGSAERDRGRAARAAAGPGEDRRLGRRDARLAALVRGAARGPRPPHGRRVRGRRRGRVPVPQVRRPARSRRRRALPPHPRRATADTGRVPAPGGVGPSRRRAPESVTAPDPTEQDAQTFRGA